CVRRRRQKSHADPIAAVQTQSLKIDGFPEGLLLSHGTHLTTRPTGLASLGSGTVCIFGGASVRASRLVCSLAPPNCTTTQAWWRVRISVSGNASGTGLRPVSFWFGPNGRDARAASTTTRRFGYIPKLPSVARLAG